MTDGRITRAVRIECEGGISGGGWSYLLEFRPLSRGSSVWETHLDTGRPVKVAHLVGPLQWRSIVAWLREREFVVSADISDSVQISGLEAWQEPIVRVACVNAEERADRSLDFLLGCSDEWIRSFFNGGDLNPDCGEVFAVVELLELLDELDLRESPIEEVASSLGAVGPTSISVLTTAAEREVEARSQRRGASLIPFDAGIERLVEAQRHLLGPSRRQHEHFGKERRIAALSRRLEDLAIATGRIPNGALTLEGGAAIDLDELNLWAAYLETRFEVSLPSQRITIRVGEATPILDGFIDECGADCWCFVTAWNPGSRPLSAEENHARNRRLRAELERSQGGVFEGEGRGADPAWPPEESFLALGVDLGAAVDLGSRYGQRAVVWGRRGEPAQLIECPSRDGGCSAA